MQLVTTFGSQGGVRKKAATFIHCYPHAVLQNPRQECSVEPLPLEDKTMCLNQSVSGLTVTGTDHWCHGIIVSSRVSEAPDGKEDKAGVQKTKSECRK